MKKPSVISRIDQGFVSIFSILIIMSILTLVAIGFANLSRQAQNRTLDNQLNTQAFYAAESGVNDAVTKLASDPTYTKQVCRNNGDGFTYDIDSAANVGYTCLLITSAGDIKFDSVPLQGAGAPKYANIETTSVISSFDITLDGTDGSVDIPNPSGSYPNILDTTTAWGTKLGVLRIDMIPTDIGLDRQTLATKSYGFYLYPTSGGGFSPLGVVNGTVDQAGLGYSKCQGNPTPVKSPCKVTIVMFGSTSKKYYLRLQAMYNPLKVSLSNFKDASNNSLSLKNGQVIIDSTGKANDVLRRIQARISPNISGFSPAFAIQSADSICKRLNIYDGNTTTDQSAISTCKIDN